MCDYGILENYENLGAGIVEFALDDYISTIKSLCTAYKKLEKTQADGFKATRHHQREGDVIRSIYKKIQNLNEISKFLCGEWVQHLTTLDTEKLFRETKKILREKGYKVGLMGLVVTTDDKGVKVFANEKEGQNGKFKTYSVGVNSKNQDGNWVNGYINCRFRKGVSVANKAKIKINSAFFVAAKSKDKTFTHLMITDFEVLEPGETAGDGEDEFLSIPDTVDEETPFL